MLGLNDTLPLHLQLAMMRLFASNGAWQSSNVNWPQLLMQWSSFLPRPKTPLEKWEDVLQAQAQEARHEQQERKRQRQRRSQNQQGDNDSPFSAFTEHPAFKAALANEAFTRTQSFLEGVNAVLHSDYTRKDTPFKILWQHGECRLLDYAPRAVNATALFIVPSLINRAYVLDIHPEHSFIAHLVRSGFRPLVLDWGIPDAETMSYGCADYISGKALPAFTAAREAHDGPIALVGYCMGGVFAVAMAQLLGHTCDALLLLATPWDFSAPDSPRVTLAGPAALILRHAFSSMNPVPAAVINTCFHLIDPWAIQKRYERFPTLSDDEKVLFLATEHWLSEGIPLSNKVAAETFVDWPHDNLLHEGQFKVGRSWIEPQRITCPALAVIPAHDKIVPASCALPLAERLPKCDIIQPELGHVSMVTSLSAPSHMWKPLVKWLYARF